MYLILKKHRKIAEHHFYFLLVFVLKTVFNNYQTRILLQKFIFDVIKMKNVLTYDFPSDTYATLRNIQRIHF